MKRDKFQYLFNKIVINVLFVNVLSLPILAFLVKKDVVDTSVIGKLLSYLDIWSENTYQYKTN